MKVTQIIVFAVVLTGCGLEAPQKAQSVSDGVGSAHFEARSNATDVEEIDVLFPSLPNGLPAPGAPFPAVVFIQGGAVETADYAWQAQLLVKAGYVVALPKHPLNLAFFSIANGEAARQLLVEPQRSVLSGLVDAKRIAVAGHSLGGVVATKLALHGGFKAIALEASYPDSADDAKLPSLGIPSLSLAGEKDCSAPLESVKAGWQKLPMPTALVVMSGATHYQFTASDAPDVAKKCAPGVELETTHERIGKVLTVFFNQAMFDGSIPVRALTSIDGVEVTTR